MTVEELKEEAKKLGYNIIPKSIRKPMLPCKECGNNRRKHTYIYDALNGKAYERLTCTKCGFEVSGLEGSDAIKKWNEVMSK